MSSSSASMSTTPWLHFGNSDYLIFETWRPSSHGGIAGACVGLFLFCVLQRCLAAYRRSQELYWRAKVPMITSRLYPCPSKGNDAEAPNDNPVPVRRKLVPPFVPSQDIVRGVIEAIQSTFSYGLMLVVMTFNAAFIFSIILGLGVGEVLFGRIGHK